MKARQLITGACYGPETVKVMTQAFDDTWASIAMNFGKDADAIEAARLKLAHLVLAVATSESRDCESLKREILAAMALERFPPA